MIKASELLKLFPTLTAPKLSLYYPPLIDAMREFEINSVKRQAAFLGQLAVESGEFRWLEEIWGPTTAQLHYSLPHRKAKELGNTEPGDGFRYRGRGPIQLTGRDNYRHFGRLLHLPLEADPDLAATPAVAFRIAGLFWKNNSLNKLADEGRISAITRRINGGLSHLDRRFEYTRRALELLAERSAT